MKFMIIRKADAQTEASEMPGNTGTERESA